MMKSVLRDFTLPKLLTLRICDSYIFHTCTDFLNGNKLLLSTCNLIILDFKNMWLYCALLRLQLYTCTRKGRTEKGALPWNMKNESRKCYLIPFLYPLWSFLLFWISRMYYFLLLLWLCNFWRIDWLGKLLSF